MISDKHFRNMEVLTQCLLVIGYMPLPQYECQRSAIFRVLLGEKQDVKAYKVLKYRHYRLQRDTYIHKVNEWSQYFKVPF